MEQMYSLSCVAVKNLGCWTGPVPVGAGGMTHSGSWQHTGIPFCVSHWQEKPPAVPWMDTHVFQISNRIEKLPPFPAPCRCQGGSPRGGDSTAGPRGLAGDSVATQPGSVCDISVLMLWLKLCCLSQRHPRALEWCPS